MSDLVLVALIASVPGVLTSLGVILKLMFVDRKVVQLSRDVDGRLTELLKVSGDAREAVGKLTGISQEKANPS